MYLIILFNEFLNTPEQMPEYDLKNNYCRNVEVDRDPTIGCYTTD